MKTTHHRAAKVRAASFNEEANTVDIVWTTGASVRRTDWDGSEYDEVLSLEPDAVDLTRLNSGAPLLDTHSSQALTNVIGKVVEGSAKIENSRGIATVLLSKASDVADSVQKIREGVIKNISVGYWILASTRTEGKKGQPDVVTVTRWQPLEISAVPVAADPNAQIRNATGRRTKPRLTREQRDFAAGAAAATRLLTQSRQPVAQARGAAAARKLLAGAGRLRSEPAKPETFDGDEIAKGARMARKLLRKQ